jgi:hypothetical protein
VVPGASISQRVLPGVKLRAAGLANGHGQVSAIERKTLLGEGINIRRAGVLPAIQRQVVVGAVVRHNDEDVGTRGGCAKERGPTDKYQGERQENREDEFLFHLVRFGLPAKNSF